MHLMTHPHHLQSASRSFLGCLRISIQQENWSGGGSEYVERRSWIEWYKGRKREREGYRYISRGSRCSVRDHSWSPLSLPISRCIAAPPTVTHSHSIKYLSFIPLLNKIKLSYNKTNSFPYNSLLNAILQFFLIYDFIHTNFRIILDNSYLQITTTNSFSGFLHVLLERCDKCSHVHYRYIAIIDLTDNIKFCSKI